MADTFILTLIRHAKTQGNLEKRYVGWTDDPIIEYDLPVISHEMKKVYGSDLVRSQQTAIQYFPQAKWQALSDFRETNFGQFEMKTYEQLKENIHYRQWIENPENHKPPEGESLAEFRGRVLAGVQLIQPSAEVYTVIHGGTMRVLLMHYSPEPSQFWDWQVKHHEKYVLSFQSFEDFKEGKRCISLSVEPIMANDSM